MRLPVAATTLLTAVAMISVYWPASVLLGMFALTGVALELWEKVRSLRRVGVAVPMRRVGRAVMRGHVAAFYHLSANVVRYYSLPLVAVAWGWSPLGLPLVSLLLMAPITDYHRLEPSLSRSRFVGLYLLEMVAYQLGVWRGCWKQRTLRPLVPMLRFVR